MAVSPPPDQPLLLTYKDVARELQCCVATVKVLVRQGSLMPLRIGSRRLVRFERSEILRFIESRRTKAAG